MAARCYARRKINRWMAESVKETSEAARLAHRAVALGKEDAVALSSGGYALAYVVGKLEEGIAFIDRALALNPNLASAWYFSGWTRVYLGEAELAIEHCRHAMRLSPLDHRLFPQHALALGHFLAGRYDEASSLAGNALRDNPKYHPGLRVLAASNALAGRLEDAQKVMARLREIDPALRVSDLRILLPLRLPSDAAKYAEGLRKAGLPE
jgi:adenylate cyclase